MSNYLKIQFNLMNALFNLATVKPLRLYHAKTICIKVIFVDVYEADVTNLV